MSKNNELKNQHVIPKVYLKFFSISSKVYLYNFSDNYRPYVQSKGIGDKIFCNNEKGYYDFPNKIDPSILERYFSKIESSHYNEIMNSVCNKTDLGVNTKTLLINWLFMTKTRSSFLRDNFSEVAEFIESTTHGYRYGKESMDELSEKFKENSLKMGKVLQLSLFLDKKKFDDYFNRHLLIFGLSHWVILETTEEKQFITNDNPGFSFTSSNDIIRLNLNPINPKFNLEITDNIKFNYFVLSPKYCLQLSPILMKSDDNEQEETIESIGKKPIKIVSPSDELIDEINIAVVETANKLVIAMDKVRLESYIEMVV